LLTNGRIVSCFDRLKVLHGKGICGIGFEFVIFFVLSTLATSTTIASINQGPNVDKRELEIITLLTRNANSFAVPYSESTHQNAQVV
jgi:hypothetical protein